MSEEHNRAEFEAKCRKLGYRVVREENGYLAVDTDQLWVFWKAALATKSVPDDVPYVSLQEVRDALNTYAPQPPTDDRYMEGFNAGKKFAELSADDRVRELEKDAARWRYFIETCSSEMGYAICGFEDASNEQINKAIDQAMKEANQ